MTRRTRSYLERLVLLTLFGGYHQRRHRLRRSVLHRFRLTAPIAVLIAASLLTVSLASCDSVEPQASPGPEWQQVELPAATATGFAFAHGNGVVVETARNGVVGMMQVDWLGSVEAIPRPPGNAPILGIIPGHRRAAAVTAADDGTLVFHEFLEDSDVHLESELSPPAPQLEPLAVWWGTEDEGAILVGAYRRPGGTVGIHPMDWETDTFEPKALLFVDQDRLDEVHVAARVEATVVVGPVGPEPAQLPAGDQAWAIQTTPDFNADGQRLARSWRALALDPSPEAVTDVEGWEGDVFVAGRLDDQPLVWTVDIGRIDLPELKLGADGAVLIADPFWLGDDPAIGLETTEGPVLLLPEKGGWQQVELPMGRLADVVAIRDVRSHEEAQERPHATGDGRIFAIIDGVVWLRTY